MVRHHQHVGTQRGIGLPIDQCPLYRLADIAGQQQAVPPRVHAQHATARIAGDRCLLCVPGERMEHREAHAVPLPLLSCRARRPVVAPCPEQRVARRRPGTARGHRHRSRHVSHAAGMVGILMTDHQQIEPTDACAAQQRHHHLRPGTRSRSIARPRVVKQRMRARPHQHGGALAHVQHHRAELAMRHRRAARQHHRQHQQPAVQAHVSRRRGRDQQGHANRRQQQR
ncbi:hypothetical protein D3C72_1443180 [compost metagenome]